MILAIVGARFYDNKKFFTEKLEYFIEEYGFPDEIVSGGAKGIDTMAREFAVENDIKLTEYLPEWNIYGRGAGPVRNSKIVDHCTHVLAFPSKAGKGTQDTIKKAQKKNKIVVIEYIDTY